MIETGEVEANKLHQKVGYLSMIAAISPMLGLFGTVAGMITTFAEIAGATTQPKPADLARGIFQALVTTYEGLVVAIPMTVVFVVFRNRVINIILEVGTISEELMSRFKVKQASS
jgi:biopolymer transport protein ExbB